MRNLSFRLLAFALGGSLLALTTPWSSGVSDLLASDTMKDATGRLSRYAGKTEVACPAQDERTAVLLLIGQSNAANHAQRRMVSRHEGKVINYFDGRCYLAGSPLLGSSGTQGEPWTELGNKLIEAGAASQVVLVPVAVGGSPIADWRAGGYLNRVMVATVKRLSAHFSITQVLWHQGESDFGAGTSRAAYIRSFESMLGSLRHNGVSAPVYVSIASRCGRQPPAWTPVNEVAVAQYLLPDPAKGIFPGVNTDTFRRGDRLGDDCHWSAQGQTRFAESWLDRLAPR